MKSFALPVRLSRNGLLLLTLLFFSFGCKTYEITEFQVLKPSAVIIPADVKTLAFVDRNLSYDQDSLSQYYKINDQIRKDSLNHDSIMGTASYYGFMENISDLFRMDTIPFVKLAPTRLSDSIRTYPKLSWEKVDSICALNYSDILVVLEGDQVKTNFSVNDGEEGYWGNVDVSYWAVWRIYDPLHQEILDEYVANDSLFVEMYASSYRKLMQQQMPSRTDVLKDVSYTIGENYVNRITPQWKTVKRIYYCSGDKRMDAACYYMNLNNWEPAITLWKSMAKDNADNNANEFKLAGQAAHNLAMAYEFNGDLKEAIQWNRKSIYFFKKMKKENGNLQIAELYALSLLERKKDEIKLKRFFGE